MRSRPSLSALLAVAIVLVVGSCTSSTEPPRITSVQLTPGAVTLDAIGASQLIAAVVLDQRGAAMSAAGLSWATSAPGVATVSASGLITAAANGTANISATVGGETSQVQVTVAQTPLAPRIMTGNAQSGTVLQTLSGPLQVRIEDRIGNAMAGRAVTFAVASGGGSITTTSTTSNADGFASTTWTLGSSTSTFHRVSAAVEGNANITYFIANPLAGPAVQMRVAPDNSADGQAAQFATAVALNPAVQLLDVLGNGVAGQTVTFAVVSGGGSLTGASAVTNGTGIATVGSWTVGAALGSNSIQASYGGFAPILFTARSVVDICAPDAASPLTINVLRSSTISSTDCRTTAQQNFEWHRFDLASSTSLIIEMSTTLTAVAFDPWLELYEFNSLTLIAENDDIQSGVLTNSRIPVTLPAGAYLLRARTFDPGQGGPYTLLARTALLGVPSRVSVNAGNGQVAAPGAVTAVAPSVRVTDEADLPVAGVSVQFATVTGVGAISGASVVTNASGIATVGSWTLAAGANVLSATVTSASPAGNPVVISATGKTSTAGFDIGLRFVSVPSATQLQTFSNAAARWEAVITGDVPSQIINRLAGYCNSPGAINETVDDLIIVVRLEPIDGVGAVLGSAGPCDVRAGSVLPALGTMRFDTADLANLEANGNFGNVILHEMGHVLGVGTIWSNKGFLVNPSTATISLDTHFSGPLAITAFNNVGGATYTGGGTGGAKVPVENRLDETNPPRSFAGTRNSHWRETVLQNELMTGFLNAGSNPLSQLTIASMQDIGYTVNASVADPFFVATSLQAADDAPRPLLEMKNDVRTGPIHVVDHLGRGPGGASAPVPVKKKASKPAR